MKTITKSQYDMFHPYLPVQRGNVSILNLTLINAVLFIFELFWYLFFVGIIIFLPVWIWFKVFDWFFPSDD